MATAQTKGVLGAGPTRNRGGGLSCGSGKKGGSLPRHIPVLDIYASAPPPLPRGQTLSTPNSPPELHHGLVC